MANFLRTAAAALMLGASLAMPPVGQRHTPTFEHRAMYDGAGKKVAAKVHPKHNAKRSTSKWARYSNAVVATHSVLFGRKQVDPRDDKYLHSHARAMRRLSTAFAERSAA